MQEYKDYNYTTVQTHNDDYIYNHLLKILKNHKNKTILDVGCGSGLVTCRLIDEGFDIWGIDASESGIAVANKQHPERFFVQDIATKELPIALKNKKFNMVISTEVIEHVYSPRDYMKFIQSILAKTTEGELIVSTPYHGYFKNLTVALTGKMDDHFTALWSGGHIKFWSKKTLSQLLEEFNFQVIDFQGCGRLPYLWKSMLIHAKQKI